MRAGGTLAQFATPAGLLSRPADPFVAGFVGRDRGYRALGFAAAGSLPLAAERPVRLGSPLRAARDRADGGWVLVLDAGQRPLGWLATGRLPDEALRDDVSTGLLHLGGTLATEAGTLREALDAALSSPSGRGVVVHHDGRFAGTVTASQVLSLIETRAARGRDSAARGAAGDQATRRHLAAGDIAAARTGRY
jgi:osmoprotectant transport system ATP-binding protein